MFSILKEHKLFEEIYKKIVTDGSVMLIGVWDKDGLEVDKRIYKDIDKMNTDVIGAEIGDIVSRIVEFKYYDSYMVKLLYRKFNLYVYSISSDYFMLIAADKNSIAAKISFYIELYKDRIVEKLL